MYGKNGSGKSTLLKVIANSLGLRGKEQATSNKCGIVNYCDKFESKCRWCWGDDDDGYEIRENPSDSRYIKSEDILYEIEKIQQKQVLSSGMECDYVQSGMTLREAREFVNSVQGMKQRSYIEFAQEKYSNGETSLQYFDEYLKPLH